MERSTTFIKIEQDNCNCPRRHEAYDRNVIKAHARECNFSSLMRSSYPFEFQLFTLDVMVEMISRISQGQQALIEETIRSKAELSNVLGLMSSTGGSARTDPNLTSEVSQLKSEMAEIKTLLYCLIRMFQPASPTVGQ